MDFALKKVLNTCAIRLFGKTLCSIFVQNCYMNGKPTPYKNTSLGKKEQITQMFNTLSRRYDGLNRLISFGIDKKWRKKVVTIVKSCEPETVLDVATGTGDLALALVKTKAKKIVGVDISADMLTVATEKISRKKLSGKIEVVRADGERLPFADKAFDAVTVAFGLRNFENLEKGLSEIYRVLKSGGVFAVLETSVPQKTPYKQGYHLYAKTLPLIGKVFAGQRDAYAYLSESAAVFPHGEAFNNILRKIGFIEVTHQPQTMGVVTIYRASK